MYILLGINCLIAILLYLYLKRRSIFLYLPASMMLMTLIDYPLIGEGNFINSFFIIVVSSIFIIYYVCSKTAAFAVKRLNEIILLTFFMIPLIPLLLATSIHTKYLSTAYLSVSVFIIGAIIFILSAFNQFNQNRKLNRFIKAPFLVGQLLMYSSIVLMTLFMPYFFVYFIWFILYATHLIKESRR